MELRRYLQALSVIMSATLMLVSAMPNELDGNVTVSELKKGLKSFFFNCNFSTQTDLFLCQFNTTCRTFLTK